MTYLDKFTRAYLEAALLTEQEELPKAIIPDIAAQHIRGIAKDCLEFQMQNKDLLDRACQTPGYTQSRAGHDFWLTRNHHGVGFLDRDLGEVGEKLTQASHVLGESDAYRGDDGQIYFTNLLSDRKKNKIK